MIGCTDLRLQKEEAKNTKRETEQPEKPHTANPKRSILRDRSCSCMAVRGKHY